MIDKLTSRLSAARLQSSQSVNDDEEPEKDELQIIDEILSTSRRHPLADLPAAPQGLSAVQVRDRVSAGLTMWQMWQMPRASGLRGPPEVEKFFQPVSSGVI